MILIVGAAALAGLCLPLAAVFAVGEKVYAFVKRRRKSKM